MKSMSSALREELHELLDRLDEAQLPQAKQRLHELGADNRDPFADMDPEERKKLHASLEASERDLAAGRVRSLDDYLAALRAR